VKKGTYLAVVFLLCFITIQAQRPGFHHEVKNLLVAADSTYQLNSSKHITALAFRYFGELSSSGAWVAVDGDTLLLVPDEHVSSVDGWNAAQLLTFPRTQKSSSFYSGALNGKMAIHFLSANPIKSVVNSQTAGKSAANCEEPEAIDQEVWRNGLPEPDYNRSFTDVKHVIIHHSAGSNSNTDYTQVVRDIYVYHTQVNGWSDIGYNYLIAQDGTLYKGRDPLNGEQDDVQGAHFCGMNSNTMGVCLLGTYTSIAPSAATEATLMNLVSWKLYKEQLNPKAAFPFNGIPSLNVLSGHRDGCATACPGQLTYDRLPTYVQTVYDRWSACNGKEVLVANFSYFPLEIEEGESVQFTDLSLGGPDRWEWYFESGRPAFVNGKRPPAIQYLYPGKFDVTLKVTNGSQADSTTLTDAIVVRKKRYPILAPNPSGTDIGFTVHFEAEALTHHIIVYSALGVELAERYATSGAVYFDTHHWKSGLYFVHIRTSNGDSVLPLMLR
jgi:hypothetical protein